MINNTKKSLRTTACTTFLKTLVMIFNVLFLLIGLALTVVGIYGYRMFKQFFSFAPSTAIYIPIISIGIFMIVVGALSLWCTPKGVSYLLYLYSVIVFVLFLTTFTIGVLFFARRDTIETTFKSGVDKLISKYPIDAESIDVLQANIKCCGSANYKDWFESEWANRTNKVPKSCCMAKTECIFDNIDVKNVTGIYETGCFVRFNETIEKNYGKICGILFASAFVILAGFALSYMLGDNLRNNRYEQMQ